MDLRGIDSSGSCGRSWPRSAGHRSLGAGVSAEHTGTSSFFGSLRWASPMDWSRPRGRPEHQERDSQTVVLSDGGSDLGRSLVRPSEW